MPSKQKIVVSVPGRVCLFGEHQDFLGLSVIAMAIGLRMRFEALPRNDRRLVIHMPDISEREEIDPTVEITYEKPRDYLRSVVNVLKRRGMQLERGYDVTITSDIPINAGVSTSSAMVIGWTSLLLELDNSPLKDDAEEIAGIGHQAEVLEFNEPGGMMDHFACSLGKLLYIDCAKPFRAERLEAEIHGIVLGNSREKKDTLGALQSTRENYRQGEDRIKELLPGFVLKTTPFDEVKPLLAKLPEIERGPVYATLRNRDICQEAKRKIMSGESEAIGELLGEHHALLRDYLGISTRKIERMISAAMSAGALGCKINGSGGGGTMIAFAPGKEEEVAEALRGQDADAYIVEEAEGVRREY